MKRTGNARRNARGLVSPERQHGTRYTRECPRSLRNRAATAGELSTRDTPAACRVAAAALNAR